jgi:hypothetical protein
MDVHGVYTVYLIYSFYYLHFMSLETNIYYVHPYFRLYGKKDESYYKAD